MAEKKRTNWIFLGALVFIVYTFFASLPIPGESVLTPRWIAPLESGASIPLGASTPPSPDGHTPFRVGARFGYFDGQGRFALNRSTDGNLSFDADRWTEYEAAPDNIEIHSIRDKAQVILQNPKGYPVLMDDRIFVVGSEQSDLSSWDTDGSMRWKYDFPAPITSLDAAAGFVLVGCLNGALELIDQAGREVYAFEPGGSRIPIILGARISEDGKRLAVISGIDPQRFLILERFGESYKVVYHEFIGDGFRRPVYISFIDRGKTVAFERSAALGLYEIGSRSSNRIPIDGRIIGMEEDGSMGQLFVLSAGSERKSLVGIKLPDRVSIEASFRSDTTFISREDKSLYIGGDGMLAAFDIGRR